MRSHCVRYAFALRSHCVRIALALRLHCVRYALAMLQHYRSQCYYIKLNKIKLNKINKHTNVCLFYIQTKKFFTKKEFSNRNEKQIFNKRVCEEILK
jgi:hypothetical protein